VYQIWTPYDARFVELMSIHGDTLKWLSTCRYLGVYFTSGRTFRCSYDSAKSSLFRAFNAINAKSDVLIGRNCSYSYSKCLPILLYATETCPQLVQDQSSLEFTTKTVFMKIFLPSSSAAIAECQRNFNCLSVQRKLTIHTAKFLQAFAASGNHICSLF